MNRLKNLGKLLHRPKLFKADEPAPQTNLIPEATAKEQKVIPSSNKLEIQPKQITNQQQQPSQKKGKIYVTQGPHLYVSQLLLNKGPLSANEIWHAYERDKIAHQQNILRSKTYLRHKILPVMKEMSKISSAGYSLTQKKHLGYKLHPETAFKNVSPDIVLSLGDKIPEKLRLKVEKKVNKDQVSNA